MSVQEYAVAAVMLLVVGYTVRRILLLGRSVRSGKSDFCSGCSGCSLKQRNLAGKGDDRCRKPKEN